MADQKKSSGSITRRSALGLGGIGVGSGSGEQDDGEDRRDHGQRQVPEHPRPVQDEERPDVEREEAQILHRPSLAPEPATLTGGFAEPAAGRDADRRSFFAYPARIRGSPEYGGRS